jgi:predicted nucleic acid-binding protein
MIVVSDTSPLNYLLLIGEIELLPRLYGRILVPPAVLDELRASASPAVVQAWSRTPPPWVETRAPGAESGSILPELQAGEREAILLAAEVGADLLLLDERAGWRAAQARGLLVAGTLAVLMNAGWRGLLDLDDALGRLRQTSFHATETLFQFVRQRYAAGPPA